MKALTFTSYCSVLFRILRISNSRTRNEPILEKTYTMRREPKVAMRTSPRPHHLLQITTSKWIFARLITRPYLERPRDPMDMSGLHVHKPDGVCSAHNGIRILMIWLEAGIVNLILTLDCNEEKVERAMDPTEGSHSIPGPAIEY